MEFKYYINANYEMPVIDGRIDLFHLKLFIAIAIGNTLDEIDEKTGCALLRQPSGNRWFIPSLDTSQKEELKLIDVFGCPSLDPLTKPAFIQLVMAQYPMTINPIVSENGVLKGVWRAESITMASAANSSKELASAVLRGFNEVIVTENAQFNLAVVENVIGQAGFNQKAYFYYDDDIELPKLLFMTNQVYEKITADSPFGDFLVPMPEIDRYAFVPKLLTFKDNGTEFSLVRHLETGKQRAILLAGNRDRASKEKEAVYSKH